MKYPCLVVDHDDTVVNSTATVHYPCFVEYTRRYFPHYRCTLEEYFIKNFDPGVVAFFRDDVGLTAQQMHDEQDYWNAYVQRHVPRAYPGMAEVLWEQKRRGGLLCVVSHSVDTSIRRDYLANGLPAPDLVFGWEQPPERRKPSVWPLQEIMSRLGCEPEELLMVDDLRPGLEMARHAGVDFAAALWGNPDPGVRAEMRQAAPLAFEQPEALEHWLFDEPASQL